MNQTHIKPDHKTWKKQTAKTRAKNIMYIIASIAMTVMIAYALVSTIAVPCGAGEASWNLWAMMVRVATGGIG